MRFDTLNNCIFVRLVCSHKTNKHQSNCCIESHPGYVLESLGSYPTLIEAPPSPERGLWGEARRKSLLESLPLLDASDEVRTAWLRAKWKV